MYWHPCRRGRLDQRSDRLGNKKQNRCCRAPQKLKTSIGTCDRTSLRPLQRRKLVTAEGTWRFLPHKSTYISSQQTPVVSIIINQYYNQAACKTVCRCRILYNSFGSRSQVMSIPKPTSKHISFIVLLRPQYGLGILIRIQQSQIPYGPRLGRILPRVSGLRFPIRMLQRPCLRRLYSPNKFISICSPPALLVKDKAHGTRKVSAELGCWATDLFLVVQAFVVVFHHRQAFRLARIVFGVGVDDVAGEEFLPEGKAAGRTWLGRGRVSVIGGSNGVGTSEVG